MAITVLSFPGNEPLGPDGGRALVQAGGELHALDSWDALLRAASLKAERGLLLVELGALITIWRAAPSLPLTRPPDGWYVVGIWLGAPVSPTAVQEINAWGIAEICAVQDLAGRVGAMRLLNRTRIGWFGRMIREEVEGAADTHVRDDVLRVVGATLSAIAHGEATAGAVARGLHMSRSSLDRLAKRAGLVPPSTLVHRTRLVLAALLRTDPTRRRKAWKDLGFNSPGHLSTRFRAHFGTNLRDLDREPPEEWIENLVRRMFIGGTATVSKDSTRSVTY